MTRDQFTPWMKEHFRWASDLLLGLTNGTEDLSIALDAEHSLFLRLNANRVRQNTWLEQMGLTLKLQSDRRTATLKFTLSGEKSLDERRALHALETLRHEIRHLPEEPHQVPMSNNGRSDHTHAVRLLSETEAIEALTGPAEGSDLAGFYCAGPLISANRNSKGQDHWFATENFFMDYSLYNGEKAVKGCTAGLEWKDAEWAASLAQARNQLSLLSRPVCDVKPGSYRSYLAPGAVGEIMQMMGWGALSFGGYKRGQSPLKKMADESPQKIRMSDKFTLLENFDLGFSPAFNAQGEVAPQKMALIEQGELKNWLVSSRSAKEYGVPPTFAAEGEGPRSLELLGGTLGTEQILKELGTGLYLSNLHYVNWSDPQHARVTGMTRYACFWVEKGEIIGPIKDLRFDVSLFDIWSPASLVSLTNFTEMQPSTWTYDKRSLGGMKMPGMLVEGFRFTL